MDRDASTGSGLGRYRVLGGAAAWCVPLTTAALATAALALGLPELSVAVGVLGWVGHGVARSLVVEPAPAGLTRGVVLRDRFLGRATLMPWRTIAEVRTDWARPGDDSALAATVRDADGGTMHFSTSMGVGDFWACLADVVRNAPGAERTGLTDTLLVDGPPARHHARASAMVAGRLALILLVLVGIHYVWAQGRSSFARYLEEVQAVPPRP
jgi:hypothetical protein